MMVTGKTIVVTGGNSGSGAAIDVVADAVVPRQRLRRETPPPGHLKPGFTVDGRRIPFTAALPGD